MRDAARGAVEQARLSVVNSGGRLNGCMDDLPQPEFDLRLVLVIDPDPKGGWRVRELNGRPIAHG